MCVAHAQSQSATDRLTVKQRTKSGPQIIISTRREMLIVVNCRHKK